MTATLCRPRQISEKHPDSDHVRPNRRNQCILLLLRPTPFAFVFPELLTIYLIQVLGRLAFSQPLLGFQPSQYYSRPEAAFGSERSLPSLLACMDTSGKYKYHVMNTFL